MAHLIESKTLTLLSVVFVLPLLAIACRDFDDRAGSSGLTTPPIIVAEGIWEGDWTTLVGSGDAGSVAFVIDQDDNGVLSGCSCWTGSACWDDGLFTGSVETGSLNATTVLEILRDPLGTVPRIGTTVTNGNLDIIGDLLTGSFAVVRDDARRCTDAIRRTGDEGTLRMTRTAIEVDAVDVCADLALEAACSDFVLPTD